MADLITAQNLYWRSSKDESCEILKNISLTLKKNDFIVLRGLPGSGKSKLLKILAGRITPSSGILEYYNQNYKYFFKDKLKNKIGYIDETGIFLNSCNLYGNMEYVLKLQGTPKEIIFDRIMHILKMTDLIAKRDMIPEDLSFSEKKILALGMVLAKEVEILLCDFNIVSFAEEENIIRLLKKATYMGAGVIVTARKDTVVNEVKVKYIDIIDGKIK